MDLYQLEYFLEAARQRSFTRAAAKLNLAQAALSEQMRKLEAELGAKLFNRGRLETTLTPAGETLRLHAEALLAQAGMARRAVQPQDLLRLPLQDRRRDGRPGVPSMRRPRHWASNQLEKDPWAK